MGIHTNSGLKLYMESALAVAKTITAATNAAPGIFTSISHGYTNGDPVLIECQGMSEINNRVFKVISVTTDTFKLADVDGATGIDTSNFSPFLSGTAKKVTFGTSITGVQDFGLQGGDIKMQDATTVNDTVDSEVVVGASAMSYDMTMQWDPANAAQQAMQSAFMVRAAKCFKVQWPDGAHVMFYGTVGYTMAPGGGKQGVTTSPAKVALRGPITPYAA
jgi:hypothetical protein